MTDPLPTAKQDDGLTPDQRRLQAAAGLRKAVAEADKAEADALTARLPTAASGPPEGTVEVGEDVGLIGQAVAYRLLGRGAAEIASQIGEHVGQGSVLIVAGRDLAMDAWTSQTVREQLASETRALDGLLGAFAELEQEDRRAGGRLFVESVAAVGVLAGAAAAVSDLFRSHYTLTARAVTLGSDPLVAALVRELRSSASRVAVDGFTVGQSAIVGAFQTARQKRVTLAGKVMQLRARRLDPADRDIADLRAPLVQANAEVVESIAAGGTQTADLKQHAQDAAAAVAGAEAAVAEVRALVALSEAAIAQFDAFAAAVTAGEAPPLRTAALRERLHEGEERHTHVLYASAESAGAETITRQSRFGGTEAGFLGGLQLSYLLLDVERDEIVAAGTQPLLGHVKYKLSEATLEGLKVLE